MKIQKLRFSCIWTVSLLNDMEHNVLGESIKHKNIFDQIIHGNSSEFSLPWNDNYKKKSLWQNNLDNSFFWKHYLELQELSPARYYTKLLEKSHDDSSFQRVWTHLLPLRDKTLKIKTESTKQNIKLESFCYPCGIGIVATVFIKTNSSLESTIDNVVKARRETHKISYDDGSSDICTLQELAQKQANRLYKKLFPTLPFDIALNNICLPKEAFTITTIIDAKETQNELCRDLSQDTNTYDNLVAGLCSFERNWKKIQPEENFLVDKIKYKQREEFFKHFIIGTENSRLIWFPEHFTENLTEEKNINRLGRYHRHLSLLGLQTEILIKILIDYNQLATTSHEHDYIARRALLLIKLLKKSSKIKHGVFQSYSAAKHIQSFSDVISDANLKARGKCFKFDNVTQ